MMYEDFFAERMASLRMKRSVSAREMSLSIGQNESYINRIENKQTFPSMQAFFYICEYFQITPKDFFDPGNPNPTRINDIINILYALDDEQLEIIFNVAKELSHKREETINKPIPPWTKSARPIGT